MISANIESDILKAALNCLVEKYPLKILNKEVEKVESDTGWIYDTVVTVSYDDIEFQLIIETKPRLDKAGAALSYSQKGKKRPVVLVTSYISPVMAERLKDYGIEFFDTCGNVFINRPPVYIYVKGNKADPALKKPRSIRVFKSSGLKLIFTLLSIPDSEKKSFRKLSKLSNVSLGTVNDIIRDLIIHGYFIDGDKHDRRLIKKKELLDRWVIAYPEELRRKLKRKTFKAEDNLWWKNAKPDNDEMWGGEIAATELTGFLNPATGTIYAKPPYTKITFKYKLRNDPQGPIEILEKFWNFDQVKSNTLTVPPILVYADLISIGDTRTIETARLIYNDYIAQLIG